MNTRQGSSPLVRRCAEILLVCLASLTASGVWAHGEVADPALVDNGRALANAKGCVGCHGKNGIAHINNYPNLAAQNFKYLVHELESFAADKRIDDRSGGMNLIAKELSADEIRALAAYFSSQKHIHPKKRNPIK